ncbi:MAG: hypothetical protein E7E21_13335 [Peptostreptococcaceae bacterium]|nr:hypothetical protein [Peptostreptococcaceae bacterium]
MKQLKKSTYRQKKLLASNGFDYMEWLLERQDHNSYTYVHRDTKEIMILRFK